MLIFFVSFGLHVLKNPFLMLILLNLSNLLCAGPLHDVSQSDLSLFFNHLGGLGYAIASREDNAMGECCSEFLLLKVGDWTARKHAQPSIDNQ